MSLDFLQQVNVKKLKKLEKWLKLMNKIFMYFRKCHF